MRRVLFSDLHGRAQALEDLIATETGTLISAGDVLGLSSHNMQCLRLLKEHGIRSVQGNHELCMMRIYAPYLEPWAIEWISDWPLELVDDQALVTHTLLSLETGGVRYLDIEQPYQARQLLERRQLAFTGHIHLPGWWEWDGVSAPVWHSVYRPTVLQLQPERRYLIQLGSLGEPRDEHHPNYVVWTPAQVEFKSRTPRDR